MENPIHCLEGREHFEADQNISPQMKTRDSESLREPKMIEITINHVWLSVLLVSYGGGLGLILELHVRKCNHP